MRDDRVVAALERRMRRPLALAAAAFFITLGVFVVGITVIVHSTTTAEVRFPAVVTVAAPAPMRSAVAVSFPAAVVGKTTHATLARGGAAQMLTGTTGTSSIGSAGGP
jgi:hypothetical protein